MNKPLSKQEHSEILRKFEFRGSQYPILLTELKSTNVEGQFQELVLYGVPSVSDGRYMPHGKQYPCYLCILRK